ncbi:hypothetical protein [Mycobacteroides abscessus]|uniref:hypothetical protein n=1 Tax=unclassified Desemzia TaxID=2685243 RepID=UPI00104A670A
MALFESVKNIVKDDVILDAIIERSIERLKTFGIELGTEDAFELSYAIGKVKETILNETNLLSIPEGLIYTAVNMVCGEFLNVRQLTGRLSEFDSKQALKSIKTGDVTTTFQDGGSSGIDVLIGQLMNYGRGDLLSYRKIKW